MTPTPHPNDGSNPSMTTPRGRRFVMTAFDRRLDPGERRALVAPTALLDEGHQSSAYPARPVSGT
jgi:hypothetical protein